MEKLTMRFLLLSSVLLGITACSTHKYGMAVKGDSFLNAKPLIRTATYNTQIDFWGRHLSGLMVFKATSDTTERVVFLTETGFKFFDFEFAANRFQVIYCFPSLNRKMVINTLKRDLGYLTLAKNDNLQACFKTDSSFTYQIKKGSKFDFYTEDKDHIITREEYGRVWKKDLVINFSGIKTGNPDLIRVNDFAAHLRVYLKQIDK